jgi:hypothetical protein
METQVKEEKKLALKRVPPGDKWIFNIDSRFDTSSVVVYPSLTDGLEAWYQKNGDTQFFMDARKGTVEVVSTIEVEVPQKTFSLYGED